MPAIYCWNCRRGNYPSTLRDAREPWKPHRITCEWCGTVLEEGRTLDAPPDPDPKEAAHHD